jgi:4-amino-4-deoxy-L-arabinose transferase-like glycosyltransferase
MQHAALVIERDMRYRNIVLVGIAAVCGLALIGFIVARGVLGEMPGANSYGALADALLKGRLWIEKCPDADCALFNGKTYVIFPPLPALIVMPFVALFGFAGFKGFFALALFFSGASLLLWRQIFRTLDVARADALWLLMALAFASPLFQVTARADGVWFFAQAIAFFFTTTAIWAVLCRASLPLAGLCVALAFLCRQMSIFYPLFLAVLILKDDQRILRPSRAMIGQVALAAVPIVVALLVIFAYDAARFGNPLDTGYAYLSNPGHDSFIARRIADHGLFSRDYVFFNALYLFVQGLHFEFGGPYLTQLTGIDKSGVALLESSPWLLLAFFARLDRTFAAGIMLFYHGNGFAQLNTQRFVLDWLPILVVLMVRGKRPAAFDALPLLVTWAVVTNTIVVGLAAYYRL